MKGMSHLPLSLGKVFWLLGRELRLVMAGGSAGSAGTASSCIGGSCLPCIT